MATLVPLALSREIKDRAFLQSAAAPSEECLKINLALREHETDKVVPLALEPKDPARNKGLNH